MTRLLTTSLVVILLVACEQASLLGPLGGATITVSDLRTGEIISSGNVTRDLAAVQSDPKFAGADDLKILRQVGQFDLRALPVAPARYYLVTLTGGAGHDSNGDGLIDATGSKVSGPVHGLVTGAGIASGGHAFGALSEAAWQWVREHVPVLTDAELTAVLDEFAASVLDDVLDLEPGVVDYSDLLAYNPLYFDAALFTGSHAALADLENAIAAGAADAERLAIVRELTPLTVPTGVSDAWFREVVSPDVALGVCGVCHLEGGIGAVGPHVLVPASDPDHLQKNNQIYQTLVDGSDAQTVLTYALGGNGHQGGQQLLTGTAEYEALAIYLALLDGSYGEASADAGPLGGFAVADRERTLRRASILLAGALPTEDELATVAAGDDQTLRGMVRQLMQGDGFHRFLIEGANDRLLTDKWLDNTPVELLFLPHYPDLVNQLALLGDSDQTVELLELIEGTGFGIARQPLEMIAHVVEEERPYTEILTADYTMVNPQLALAFGSANSFEDSSNINQWQVGQVESYTRIDESMIYLEAERVGAYVFGGLATNYPQAGVLNTPGWLARYPSTDTNRNRARSRWTWYHFLGFDIEGSATRTTDPDALADTDNPTLNNPNCTGCHELMDPVAGAYQNYGDRGFYKDKLGGQDSLPALYKLDRSLEVPYSPGETWYNDMRTPGFDGGLYTNQESTLQGLAADIVADPRFAGAAVKFWWPALMGEEAASAPVDEGDQDYAQRLALFQAQTETIDALAAGFAAGFNGGAPYNLKDLLVEMVMSPWFRGVAFEDDANADEPTLRGVGFGKLLTPEQLDRKTEAVTGYRWYETERRGVTDSLLTLQYRLFYGGIDSDGVTSRATEMTSLMSTVVEAQPLQMGCVLVGLEFQSPASLRLIFPEIEKTQHEGNAEDAVRRQLQHMHRRFLGENPGQDDPEIDRALALFTETRRARIDNGYPAQLDGSDEESCPFHLVNTRGWDLSDPDHTLNSWISMLIYYMTDYRYVYE